MPKRLLGADITKNQNFPFTTHSLHTWDFISDLLAMRRDVLPHIPHFKCRKICAKKGGGHYDL
jgi:hypothetical protein